MTAIGPTESIHVFFWSTIREGGQVSCRHAQRAAGTVRSRGQRQSGEGRAVRLRRVDRGGGAPRKAVGIGEPVSLDEDRHFTDVAEIPGLLAGPACRITFGAAAPHAVFDPDHRLVERGRGERPAVRSAGLAPRSRDPVPAPAVPPVDARGSHPLVPVSSSSSPGVPSRAPGSSSRSNSWSRQRSRTKGLAGGLSRRSSPRSPSNGFGSWFSSGPSPGSRPPRGGSGSGSSSRRRGFGSQGSPRSRSCSRSSPTVRG